MALEATFGLERPPKPESRERALSNFEPDSGLEKDAENLGRKPFLSKMYELAASLYDRAAGNRQKEYFNEAKDQSGPEAAEKGESRLKRIGRFLTRERESAIVSQGGKIGYDSIASIAGVKGIIDWSLYLGKAGLKKVGIDVKTSMRGDVDKFFTENAVERSLLGITNKAIELRRADKGVQRKSGPDGKMRLVGIGGEENLGTYRESKKELLQATRLFKEKIADVNISAEKRKELQRELALIMKDYKLRQAELQKGQSEKYDNAMRKYTGQKVNAFKLGKDAVNSALTCTGFFMLRGIGYGTFAALERGKGEWDKYSRSAFKARKDEGEQAGDWKSAYNEVSAEKMKAVLRGTTVNAARETYNEIIHGRKEGKLGAEEMKKKLEFEKAEMERLEKDGAGHFGKAWHKIKMRSPEYLARLRGLGTVARAFGIGGVSYMAYATEGASLVQPYNQLIDSIEQHRVLDTAGQNIVGGVDRTIKLFDLEEWQKRVDLVSQRASGHTLSENFAKLRNSWQEMGVAYAGEKPEALARAEEEYFRCEDNIKRLEESYNNFKKDLSVSEKDYLDATKKLAGTDPSSPEYAKAKADADAKEEKFDALKEQEEGTEKIYEGKKPFYEKLLKSSKSELEAESKKVTGGEPVSPGAPEAETPEIPVSAAPSNAETIPPPDTSAQVSANKAPAEATSAPASKEEVLPVPPDSSAPQKEILEKYGLDLKEQPSPEKVKEFEQIYKALSEERKLTASQSKEVMALYYGGDANTFSGEHLLKVSELAKGSKGLDAESLGRIANVLDEETVNQLEYMLDEKNRITGAGNQKKLRAAILENFLKTGNINDSLATVYDGEGVEHGLRRLIEASPNEYGFKKDLVNDFGGNKGKFLKALRDYSGKEAHRLAINGGLAEIQGKGKMKELRIKEANKYSISAYADYNNEGEPENVKVRVLELEKAGDYRNYKTIAVARNGEIYDGNEEVMKKYDKKSLVEALKGEKIVNEPRSEQTKKSAILGEKKPEKSQTASEADKPVVLEEAGKKEVEAKQRAAIKEELKKAEDQERAEARKILPEEKKIIRAGSRQAEIQKDIQEAAEELGITDRAKEINARIRMREAEAAGQAGLKEPAALKEETISPADAIRADDYYYDDHHEAIADQNEALPEAKVEPGHGHETAKTSETEIKDNNERDVLRHFNINSGHYEKIKDMTAAEFAELIRQRDAGEKVKVLYKSGFWPWNAKERKAEMLEQTHLKDFIFFHKAETSGMTVEEVLRNYGVSRGGRIASAGLGSSGARTRAGIEDLTQGRDSWKIQESGGQPVAPQPKNLDGGQSIKPGVEIIELDALSPETGKEIPDISRLFYSPEGKPLDRPEIIARAVKEREATIDDVFSYYSKETGLKAGSKSYIRAKTDFVNYINIKGSENAELNGNRAINAYKRMGKYLEKLPEATGSSNIDYVDLDKLGVDTRGKTRALNPSPDLPLPRY
ncbi:MAG: hypothetical protein WC745_02050 [Patescibacteria group bacterium]|jgi:hypothetical protein